MNQLDKLAQHRDAILTAEIGAWLHDDFKHTDQQIHKYVSHAPSPSGRQDTADLIPNIEIDFLGKRLKLILVKNRKRDDFVDGYLNRCHYTAHIEKEDGNSQQTYPAYLSSPFGFEALQIPTNLTDSLRNNVPWNLIDNPAANRANFQVQLRELFSQVGGDTRRSGNEITLWEWGHTVGALYKAALSGAYFQLEIGHTQTDAKDLRWRLLSIRTDGLAYLTSVSRLPDLIARQQTLQIALDKVQTLLEEEYPLATEVYRDEDGSLYVVSDLPDLLNFQDSNRQTLLAHIQQQFTTDGEIVPEIKLDGKAWWGQDPDRNNNDEIPPAGYLLSLQPVVQSDPQTITTAWNGQHNEICSICGLRPCVSKQVNYCQVCGNRRKGRVADWLQNQTTTIWLDEVADSNGRLALITGTFALTDWLNDNLVKTLLVRTGSDLVVKTPSFARLRRIWRTTQTFWQETCASIHNNLSDNRRRLQVKLANAPGLTAHQTYELDLYGQTRMSVLWDGSHLISTDNLSYIAVQLNIPASKRRSPADAALEVGLWFDKSKENKQGQKHIFQLISDDEKNTQFDIQLADIDYQDTAYSTAIPILSEPRTFMALVPADKALEVTQAIKEKYEREMGKVRNRLPLHLGVVYFQRRTPLRAALEAGRRILDRKQGSRGVGEQGGKWRVMAKPEKRAGPPSDAAYFATDTQQFDEYYAVELERIEDQRTLTWYVPAVMGDGSTEDNWYPYIFLETNGDDRKVDGKRAFKGLRPTTTENPEACWLVHAGDLEECDEVYFTPATFDFEWLDTTGRRFEIAYDDKGRRRGRLHRPYLLDEVQLLKEAWQIIGGKDGLTNNQIYALRDTIRDKREAWQPAEDDCQPHTGTFWLFCRDVIRNAAWKQRPNDKIDRLTDWAVSGLLEDALELKMSIMKEKPERSQAKKETTDEQ